LIYYRIFRCWMLFCFKI